MEKDMIFFGENGLTSTSANHIANLAKESYRELESSLESLRFYDETIRLIGTNEVSLINEGKRDISYIPSVLERIAKLKSLIAWLREAIKAKDNLVREVEASSFEDYGIETPDMPVRDRYITEEDIIGSWSIKQRNRFFYLDTICAEIGTAIHPKGGFAVARDTMYEYITNPRSIHGSGRDTIVFERTATVNTDSVEEIYMGLQNSYRSYQAELNSMKHEIEVELQKNRMETDQKYRMEYSDYRNAAQECENRLTIAKQEALKHIQDMKIVIPDSLKSVYDEVSHLGK